MNHEWMKQLKVGDTVFVETRGFGTTFYKQKVTQITKIYVAVGPHQRWSLKTGRQTNADAYHTSRLLQPTPELEARYARQQLIADVSNHLELAGRLVLGDAKDVADADLKQLKDALDSIVHKHHPA